MFEFIVTSSMSAFTFTAQAVALSSVLVGYAIIFIVCAIVYCIALLYIIKVLCNWREFSLSLY